MKFGEEQFGEGQFGPVDSISGRGVAAAICGVAVVRTSRTSTFGESPFGRPVFGGAGGVLAGRVVAAAAGALDLRRRLALAAGVVAYSTGTGAVWRRAAMFGEANVGASGVLIMEVQTPLRAAPARALRVMVGARVT
jgi:hypothetical protein